MCTVFSRGGHGPRDLPLGIRMVVGIVAAGILLQGETRGFAQQSKATQVRPSPLAPVAVPATAAAAAGAAPDAAQDAWRKQSAQLLSLASQLKHEVDKTTENILSLKVIEKAREIEEFTHATEQQLKAQN